MFNFASVIILALVAISSVSAAAIPFKRDAPVSGLERYPTPSSSLENVAVVNAVSASPSAAPTAPAAAAPEEDDEDFDDEDEDAEFCDEEDDEPVSSAPAAPSPTGAVLSSAPANGDLIKGGFATFFYQNGVAGACGDVHSDGDLIAAIDSRRYGDTGKKSDLCGKKVLITNPANKKSVTATIVDACPTCIGDGNSIDLAVGAFTSIATEAEGLVPIEWKFV